MRFLERINPPRLLDNVHLAASGFTTDSEREWLEMGGVHNDPFPAGSGFNHNSNLMNQINGNWASGQCNPINFKDIFNCSPAITYSAREDAVIRLTLANLPGVKIACVVFRMGEATQFTLPASLYVPPPGRAVQLSPAMFIVDRADGGDLSILHSDGSDSRLRIEYSANNEAFIAMRRFVGNGKFEALPPIRPTLKQVRSNRRGALNDLNFPVYHDRPPLDLDFNFNNHPIPADADQVRALVEASHTAGGFNLWTGGDHLYAHGGPPDREVTWDDPLIERRMIVTAEHGGGAYGGASTGMGYSGTLSLGETAFPR